MTVNDILQIIAGAIAFILMVTLTCMAWLAAAKLICENKNDD